MAASIDSAIDIAAHTIANAIRFMIRSVLKDITVASFSPVCLQGGSVTIAVWGSDVAPKAFFVSHACSEFLIARVKCGELCAVAICQKKMLHDCDPVRLNQARPLRIADGLEIDIGGTIVVILAFTIALQASECIFD